MSLFSMIQEKQPRSEFPYKETQLHAHSALRNIFNVTKTLPTPPPTQVPVMTTVKGAPLIPGVKSSHHREIFKNAKKKSKS
jgi:hypothetical protein